MEAEFPAYYLGNAMLTKGTTGLGVIQKPLREKYFSFRKSTENRLGPEIGIRVNPGGLSLLFPGSHPGEQNDGFYELSSIHFIEAVKYVVVKEKDKKFYGAFLPIEESRAANSSKEKLFQQIEKKFSYMTKITHPPMLACVMRRPTGVKAVDCHMFVIQVTEDALQIADMVHRFQDRPVDPDFYRGGPVQSPRGRPDMYPNPDVIPREHGPRESVKRNSADDYEIYRGRGFELKQEHFHPNNNMGDKKLGGPPVETNRSFERERQYTDRGFEDRERNDYNEERNRQYRQDDAIVDMRPREGRTGAGFVERDSFGREYAFDNAAPPDQMRLGEEHERGRINSERGIVSPRTNGRFERHSDSIMRYGERPSDINRGPSWDRGPRSGPQPPRHAAGDDLYNSGIRPGQPALSPRARSPQRSDSPPRGHSSPRARSPNTTDDNIYSASNLESRIEADTAGKPVAKVPPHRHAGVRVLPSLPLLGAKNQLKPVSPRPAETSKEQREAPPSYNFSNDLSNDDPEEESPYDNAPSKVGRQDRIYSDKSYDVDRRPENVYRDQGRVKSNGYNYGYNPNQRNSGSKPGYSGETVQVQPWSFDEEKEKFLRKEQTGWNSRYQSKSQPEFQPRDRSPEYSDRKPRDAKDAEIANMFSNLRTGNLARKDIDFEDSLGYLP